jgi:excisionase family DNA binding protein
MSKAASEPIAESLSVRGLAKALGVSRQHVYNLIRQGRIKTESTTGGRVILPEEARRILQSVIRVETGNGLVKVRINRR